MERKKEKGSRIKKLVERGASRVLSWRGKEQLVEGER